MLVAPYALFIFHIIPNSFSSDHMRDCESQRMDNMQCVLGADGTAFYASLCLRYTRGNMQQLFVSTDNLLCPLCAISVTGSAGTDVMMVPWFSGPFKARVVHFVTITICFSTDCIRRYVTLLITVDTADCSLHERARRRGWPYQIR